MEPTSTASQASEFAVVVAGWFDGDTPHLDQLTTFLVRNGRIADISAGDQGAALAQRGLPVARGAFLLPGLVDAHVHLFLDGAPTDNKVRAEHLKQPLEQLTEAARRSARQALACEQGLGEHHHQRDGIRAPHVEAVAPHAEELFPGLPVDHALALPARSVRTHSVSDSCSSTMARARVQTTAKL